MLKYKKLILIVLLTVSNQTFGFFTPTRKMQFLDSRFSFWFNEQLDYVEAQGVWKLNNKKDSLIPHVVKISCDKEKKTCIKDEIYIKGRGDNDYIISDQVDFEIIQWTKKRIIASYSGVMHTGEVSCFASTLTIDILKQSVKIVSNPTSESCNNIINNNIGGYSVTGELVDGNNLYIEIGGNKMIWKENNL